MTQLLTAALLALLFALPARAQAPGPAAATTPDPEAALPACTATDWPLFWRRIRAQADTARVAVSLPNQVELAAKAVPDGSAQRLRLEHPLNPQREYLAVWLYFGPDRIEGQGGTARTVTQASGLRLAPSVPKPAPQSASETETTVSIPALAGLAGLSGLALYRTATLVVLGCDRYTHTVTFLGTTELDISDGQTMRVLAAVIVLGIYLIAALAARSGRRRRSDAPETGLAAALHPLVVTQDALGRGSLSRMQILFFTLIVVGTLLYVFLRTGVVSNLSADLLWLMGIAGAGTVLAQQVTASRQPKGAVSVAALTWLAAHGVLRESRTPRWRDLFFSGGEFDIYKLQNLVFSPFVGLTVLAAGVNDLAALDIPDNLMALLGLSQVVYVGGKAVQPAPGAEAIEAAVASASAAERAMQQAHDAATLAQGPVATLDAALARLPAEDAAWRMCARSAAEAFAHAMDEDLQQRTPAPLLRL